MDPEGMNFGIESSSIPALGWCKPATTKKKMPGQLPQAHTGECDGRGVLEGQANVQQHARFAILLGGR